MEPENEIYDLIYGPDEAKQDIKKLLPNAKVEDASDYIHTERFSVQVNMETIDWLEFLIRNGLANLSLKFELVLRENKELAEELLKRLKENPIDKEELEKRWAAAEQLREEQAQSESIDESGD